MTLTTHPLTRSYFRQLALSCGLEPEQLFEEWATSSDLELTGRPSHDRWAVLNHFPAGDCRDYRNN